MTTQSAAISVAGLLRRGGPGGKDAVLDSVDLTVCDGTLVLIVGDPGSGKSTLIRCLTGVYRPDAGRVTYRIGRDEVDVAQADSRTVAWLRGHHIGAFDGPLAVAPRLPAAVAAARAARSSRSAAIAALSRLQRMDLAGVPVGRLRATDRHVVALVAALLADRRFVLLDDPEKVADPSSVTQWLHAAIAAGAAVLVTAGHTTSLASIASSTGELRKGEIAWQET